MASAWSYTTDALDEAKAELALKPRKWGEVAA